MCLSRHNHVLVFTVTKPGMCLSRHLISFIVDNHVLVFYVTKPFICVHLYTSFFFEPPCTDKLRNTIQMDRGGNSQTNAICFIFLACLEEEQCPKKVRRFTFAFFEPPCTDKLRNTDQVDRGGNS